MSAKKTAKEDIIKPTPSVNIVIINNATGRKNRAGVIGRAKRAENINNGSNAIRKFTKPVPVADTPNTDLGIYTRLINEPLYIISVMA